MLVQQPDPRDSHVSRYATWGMSVVHDSLRVRVKKWGWKPSVRHGRVLEKQRGLCPPLYSCLGGKARG